MTCINRLAVIPAIALAVVALSVAGCATEPTGQSLTGDPVKLGEQSDDSGDAQTGTITGEIGPRGSDEPEAGERSGDSGGTQAASVRLSDEELDGVTAGDDTGDSTEVAALEPQAGLTGEQVVNRPPSVNSCPMGTENADIWGYFRDPNRQGAYAEYCFRFSAGGTLVYSDYVDEVTGTWTRSESSVKWEVPHGYTWGPRNDEVNIPLTGALTGVTFNEAGVPVAHKRLSWHGRNNYGHNNISWDLEGLPPETWRPAS